MSYEFSVQRLLLKSVIQIRNLKTKYLYRIYFLSIFSNLLPLIFKSWFTFCYDVHNYQAVSSTTNKCLNHHIELILTEKSQLLQVICNLQQGNSPCLGTATVFKIQLLSALAIKCLGKFRIFQFALAMRKQKNCQIRSDCISCQQWLQHTSAFC